MVLCCSFQFLVRKISRSSCGHVTFINVGICIKMVTKPSCLKLEEQSMLYGLCVCMCSWFVLSTHSRKVPGLNPSEASLQEACMFTYSSVGFSAGTSLSSHSAKTCMLCWLVTSSWSKETVWACKVVGVILWKQMHCSTMQPLEYNL